MSDLIDREALLRQIDIVIDTIKSMPPAEHSTNLASLGTDCISRQQAIDATKKHYRAHDNDLLELIAFDIERLPSAEPKRGRWLYCEDTTADCVDGYRCDQCGLFVPWDYQHKSIDYIKDYNFCPNCGADMRGEKE